MIVNKIWNNFLEKISTTIRVSFKGFLAFHLIIWWEFISFLNIEPSTFNLQQKKTEQSNTKKLEKVWIHIHVYLRAPNYDKNC